MIEKDIRETVERYSRLFPEDNAVTSALLSLIHGGAQIRSRKEFLGHVTCGGIVLKDDGHLLMIHHRVLDRWLFPGGHIEQSDKSLRDAALREVIEETGIDHRMFHPVGSSLDTTPIHIDCHPIPPNPHKNEPKHLHFDFRFVFRGEATAISLQTQEVCNWAWVDPHSVTQPVMDRLHRFGLIQHNGTNLM